MIVSKPVLSLLNTILDTAPMRKFWLIFYSFLGGMFFIVSMQHPFSPVTIPALGSFVLVVILILLLDNLSKKDEKVLTPKELPPQRNYEVIYILRRNDGILKFGRTTDLSSRIKGHRNDYKMTFDIVASWVVPYPRDYERLALSMTRRYAYFEQNHRELRKMTDRELRGFILSFTKELQSRLREDGL